MIIDFHKKYKQMVKIEKEQKKKETESRNKLEEDKFKFSLIKGTNSGYQAMCDNMDRNYNQRLNHIESEDSGR